ncbi:peptidase s41 family protein [Rutstroemia sp. NJR-2017a BVV2]|nr:peptidase s41 family protein [Rutstroemia sp. NJR-2017a BVV2]
MHFKTLPIQAGLVGLASAGYAKYPAGNSTTAFPTTGTSTPTSTLAACGIVSSLASVAKVASPSVDAQIHRSGCDTVSDDPIKRFTTPTVDAKLAHDCLNSVPLNTSAAIQYVTDLKPYIEWQSGELILLPQPTSRRRLIQNLDAHGNDMSKAARMDTADLKDPPADYFYPPFDVFGKLASVKSNLENGTYANEYEFQEDLYQVFAPAHDGHFVVYPDLLTKVFEWRRKRSLVSVSSDGVELPKIYLYEDITSAPSEASEVTKINGVDAVKYVEDWIFQASFNQDADAAYNTMFYEKAFVGGGVSNGYFAGGGRIRYIYPGANTTFDFANGTTLGVENYATVKVDMTGVTDGESFYQKFCVQSTATEAAASSVTTAAALVSPTGYPTPVVSTNDTIVSGYYLSEPGFEDVAVLSLLAFESDSIAEFQAVAQTFLADAVRDGKTKLVIDLSANGGGYILQGYDMFRQLFPHIVQDGYSRIKETDTFLTISKIFSEDIPADYDPNTASDETISKYETWFNYRYDYNLTNQPFLSFEDKFAPHPYKTDNYTSLMRWNLDDPLTTTNGTYGMGIEISGYGSLANISQPFAAENIIMLYDGFCASTCTLFSEFMRIQAGVKSIAMGGRPNKEQIQGVGGIKGAQVLTFASIYSYAQEAASSPNATPEDLAILNKFTTVPIERSVSTSINLRDQILRDNVNDGLPAQYVYEPADCRLYWTLPMIENVEKVWEAAADAAWNGGACVAGALPKRDVSVKQRKNVVNRKRSRNTLSVVKREETVEKDAMWDARHGRKVIS